MKIKSLSDLTEEELRKRIFDQIWPYEKLKYNIAELDKLSDPPVVKIASFLFKAQLVEYELKQFIDFLDEIVERETSVLPFKKVRSKKDSKVINEKWGLGQLRNELENYESKDIQEISNRIDLFKKQRDKFTHRLYYETDDINNLAKKCQEGQKATVECLNLMNVVTNKILREVYKLKISRLAKRNEK